MRRDEIRARLDVVRQRLAELDRTNEGRELEGEQRDEWDRLVEEQERLEDLGAELDVRLAVVAEAARHAGNREGEPERSSRRREASPGVGEVRDAALRAVDSHDRELSAEAGDRLVDLVGRDRSGVDSRYLAAVSDEDYASAFGRLVFGPPGAGQLLSAREAAAVQRVAVAQRAMSLTDSAGGYAVPFALDPTINLTSDGQVNPIRQLATVTTITTDEWRGITSAGITASFSAEAAEAADNSPTLAQPTIFPERILMFVPISFELFDDFAAIQPELGRLFADAKDVLEAEKFISGAGHASQEPEGLVAGLGAGSEVDTAAGATFAPGDLYALQEALPPRWQARASFLSSLTIANEAFRFVSDTEPQPFNPDRTRLLGKPWFEVSDMATDSSAVDAKIMLYGDVAAAYRVVDRIGLRVEIVPHLFATANNRPSGQRGLVAWARVGGGIVVDQAMRAMNVLTT